MTKLDSTAAAPAPAPPWAPRPPRHSEARSPEKMLETAPNLPRKGTKTPRDQKKIRAGADLRPPPHFFLPLLCWTSSHAGM